MGSETLASLHVLELDPLFPQLGKAGGDVVSLDDCHAESQALLPSRGGKSLRARGRVHPPGVGDDLDFPGQDFREERLDLGDEISSEACPRIARELFLKDAHRDLGQEIGRDIMDGELAQDLPAERVGIIAPVTTRVGYPNDVWHALPTGTYMRKTPTLVSSSGVFNTVARLNAKIVRVAFISMTPSSQSRAEAK